MNLFRQCFQIYLQYIIKEQRKKFGQMELYLFCFFIIHKEVTTTLLQQFLDTFQNAFRDSEQRLSSSATNNPLATKGLSLLLLHVWRFSDTGSDHITHCNSRRHARELFRESGAPGQNLEVDVFLVGPCQEAAWGSHHKWPLCATPAKPSGLWGPCGWSSATANVEMSIFRPSREQEASGRWDSTSALPGNHEHEQSNLHCLTRVTQAQDRSLWLLLHCVYEIPYF